MHAPLLISLPHGLNASGVTAWAVRLANAFAHATRPVALVLHALPPGQQPIDFALHPRIEVFDASCLPPLDICNGDLTPFLPVYRLALGTLAAQATGCPVVCSPNLVGDSYGVFAELSRQMPDLVRIIAVHHSDIPYNDLVCAHYAPTISAFVGVSDRITSRLRRMLSTRHTDIFGIPYGIELPPRVRRRKPLGQRPLRLLYAGRIDHEQKRILALIAMADELCRRGIPHELALLGDGPAAAEVDALSAHRPTIRRLSATTPAGVAEALDAADCFCLPSRYEGLSVALLEALARGCIPVLTPSRSGTAQLVLDGKTGFLAKAGPEATPQQAGSALAETLERAVRMNDDLLHEVRSRGWALVGERYSLEVCVRRYAAVIDRAAQSMPRPWSMHRPAAFTGPGGGGSGTVPANAPGLMEKVLRTLAGKRVAIFGTGRHTLELQDTIARSAAQIISFLEDDTARQGTHLWGVPIIAPEHATQLGITDIVVSSWLHQETMTARCAPLEAAGVRVHALYDNSTACAFSG